MKITIEFSDGLSLAESQDDESLHFCKIGFSPIHYVWFSVGFLLLR